MDDKYFLAQIKDKIQQCQNQYCETHTGFLDIHQQYIAHALTKYEHDIQCIFYGGFEDAERRVLLCLPDYVNAEGFASAVGHLPKSDEGQEPAWVQDLEECQPLRVIRARKAKGSRDLTHRDYLGSLIGLGIKRDMIGDILVRNDGADIIILKEIEDYLLFNYGKAGRTELTLEAVPISELIIPAGMSKEMKDTVASLRLDNIVSSAFGLPRSKASEAINHGIVFVNNVECQKVDYNVAEGDKIVLRGKGKAYLREVGGRSKKGRQYVTFEIF